VEKWEKLDGSGGQVKVSLGQFLPAFADCHIVIGWINVSMAKIISKN